MRTSPSRPASRRQVLKGAASLIAAAALPRGTQAQAKGKIVVGTWGGDYARLLNKNIEQPILIKDGWEVIQDQAGDPERRSKMLRGLSSRAVSLLAQMSENASQLAGFGSSVHAAALTEISSSSSK